MLVLLMYLMCCAMDSTQLIVNILWIVAYVVQFVNWLLGLIVTHHI